MIGNLFLNIDFFQSGNRVVQAGDFIRVLLGPYALTPLKVLDAFLDLPVGVLNALDPVFLLLHGVFRVLDPFLEEDRLFAEHRDSKEMLDHFPLVARRQFQEWLIVSVQGDKVLEHEMIHSQNLIDLLLGQPHFTLTLIGFFLCGFNPVHEKSEDIGTTAPFNPVTCVTHVELDCHQHALLVGQIHQCGQSLDLAQGGAVQGIA